jgi:hypothetical protein
MNKTSAVPQMLFVAVSVLYTITLLSITATDHTFFKHWESLFVLGAVVEFFGLLWVLMSFPKTKPKLPKLFVLKPVLSIITFLLIPCCAPLSLLIGPYVISWDYEKKLSAQKVNLEQRLEPLIHMAHTLELKQPTGRVLPRKPYVLMSAPLLENGMPDMSHSSRLSAEWHYYPYGDLAVNIDKDLLSKCPDFRDTKSIILIAENWKASGRLISLDWGSSVPELLHNVKVFVIEVPTGYIMWTSQLHVGSQAHNPIGRKPGGGVTYVSSFRGGKVGLDQLRLQDIPWDASSSSAHE